LNSPHNPTGGITLLEDLEELAEIVRDRDIAMFSDEPYDRMVWNGRHNSACWPSLGMIDQSGRCLHI
jgi:aspartate aminotransferase